MSIYLGKEKRRKIHELVATTQRKAYTGVQELAYRSEDVSRKDGIEEVRYSWPTPASPQSKSCGWSQEEEHHNKTMGRVDVYKIGVIRNQEERCTYDALRSTPPPGKPDLCVSTEKEIEKP